MSVSDSRQAMFERMRFPRAPEADFVVGGHRYAVFAHDWRADPFDTWLEDRTFRGEDGAADTPGGTVRHNPTAGSLRDLIAESATELRGSRGARSEKLYRALACTYLEPAATQELAAERLGLPFNTYRYQLAAAVKHIVDSLWYQELHGGDS
jgi:hypothetical protein